MHASGGIPVPQRMSPSPNSPLLEFRRDSKFALWKDTAQTTAWHKERAHARLDYFQEARFLQIESSSEVALVYDLVEVQRKVWVHGMLMSFNKTLNTQPVVGRKLTPWLSGKVWGCCQFFSAPCQFGRATISPHASPLFITSSKDLIADATSRSCITVAAVFSMTTSANFSVLRLLLLHSSGGHYGWEGDCLKLPVLTHVSVHLTCFESDRTVHPRSIASHGACEGKESLTKKIHDRLSLHICVTINVP